MPSSRASRRSRKREGLELPRDRVAAATVPVAATPRPVPARNGDSSAARFRVRLIVTVPAVLLWLLRMPAPAATAQQDDTLVGVRYRVDASVSIEQSSPLLARIRQAGAVDAEGSVNVQLRISANSREIRYFGIVSKDLPLRLPPANPIWYKVWEENVCHQRRGQPKLTVVRLSGRWPAGGTTGAAPQRGALSPDDAPRPTTPDKDAGPQDPTRNDLIPPTEDATRPPTTVDHPSIDFISVIRHIGMPLRDDELVPGIKLPEGVDDVGPYYALRAQTKDNRLNADLRLYAFDCQIDPARLEPGPGQPLR